MGSIDGKWTPVIMMTVIHTINGIVNALIKKVLDGGINHMVIATYRLGISTLFLLPIAYFWERKTRPKLTVSISCQLFVSALFGASLIQYFYLLGLTYTSSTLGSAFTATMPALTFIMALIFGFEKLNMKTKVGYGVVLGTMISLGGALILTMYEGTPLTTSQEQAMILNHLTKHANWSWCIKKRGPVFTSAFSPFILMSATLFDFLVFHRIVYLGSIIGSMVVVIGLYVFLWSKGKQINECEITRLPVVKEETEVEGRTNDKLGHLLVIPVTP